MTKIDIFLMIIVIMGGVFGCSEREVRKDRLFIKDGLAYAVKESEPYSGKMIGVYNNGALSEVGEFRNGKRSGRWTSWFQSGQVWETGNYVDGKKEGLWVEAWVVDDTIKYTGYMYKMGELEEVTKGVKPQIKDIDRSKEKRRKFDDLPWSQ